MLTCNLLQIRIKFIPRDYLNIYMTTKVLIHLIINLVIKA